jgi:hypothetical protein
MSRPHDAVSGTLAATSHEKREKSKKDVAGTVFMTLVGNFVQTSGQEEEAEVY